MIELHGEGGCPLLIGSIQLHGVGRTVLDADILKTLIAQELEHVSDARVVNHIRRSLVEPNAVLRDWDYGKPGEQYPC